MTISGTSKAQNSISIAICGGGIAGLSLAIGLLRHKHLSVDLYEAAPAFAEIGAGVSFSPNAVRAMGLIDPQVRKGYDRRSTKNGWESKKDAWFDFRWGMDIKSGGKAGEYFHTVVAKGLGQSSVHRAHFLDELVKLLPGSCAHFGKKVEALSYLDDGKVRMHFVDGSTADADAVIACDGIKSNIRPILLGKESPAAYAKFTGKCAYRGLIPMQKAVELLGDELARNSQMYFGYHGHVLTFPIEQGKTMNVVAFKRREGEWTDERWVLPMQRADMERDFEGWGEQVKSILSLMEKPDVWALFDHPPAERYWQGRVCLLGDAAHASTPHQGSGAGMALEDSYIMSRLFENVQSVEQIERAFQAYDEMRRQRTQRLVKTSKEAGELYDLEDASAGDDMQKVSANLDERFKWIWNHDLEDDLATALKEFKKVAH